MSAKEDKNVVVLEKELRDFDVNDPKLRCGIGPFRPAWLQWLADIRAFLVSYSLAVMVSSALNIYMISQITTLEKLFGLSSKQTGFLMSANDAGYMTVIIFASHFSRKGHKPFIIGVLGIAFGIMAIIGGMPHFLMNTYKELFYFTTAQDSALNQTDIAPTNVSAAQSVSLCNEAAVSVVMAAQETEDEVKVTVRRIAFGILAASLVVQGAVKAPRIPLSLTYFDDHVPKTKVGIYIGINMSVIIIGLAVAIGLGSLFNVIYVTLEDVEMTMRDPRWIGAWWLGFVAIGGAACVLAAPLLCFPKFLKTNKMFRQKGQDRENSIPLMDVSASKHDEMSAEEKNMEEELGDLLTDARKPGSDDVGFKLAKNELKDFPRALWRLLTNPVYGAVMVGNALWACGIMGRLVYFPKYLEVHFHMLAYQANFLFSITMLVGSAVGTVASGVIMAVFKMTPRTSLIFAIVLGLVSSLTIFFGMPLDCPQTRYQGFDLSRMIDDLPSSPDMTYHTNSSCAEACACQDHDFLPICGDDGHTYFSPCHAGCSVSSHSTTMFSNCSCMPESSNRTAVAGRCKDECSHLITYLVIAFLGPLIGCLTVTPRTVVKMRCVSEEDRSLALGVDSFIANVCGSFVAPILFGAIVDSACALWISGYCRMYDVADFRYLFHVATGVLGVVADIMYSLALIIVIFNKKFAAMFSLK